MKINHASVCRRLRHEVWKLDALCADVKKQKKSCTDAQFALMLLPHFLSFVASRENDSNYMPLWEEDERKRLGSSDDITKFFRSVLLVRAQKVAHSSKELDYVIALLAEKLIRSLTKHIVKGLLSL